MSLIHFPLLSSNQNRYNSINIHMCSGDRIWCVCCSEHIDRGNLLVELKLSWCKAIKFHPNCFRLFSKDISSFVEKYNILFASECI